MAFRFIVMSLAVLSQTCFAWWGRPYSARIQRNYYYPPTHSVRAQPAPTTQVRYPSTAVRYPAVVVPLPPKAAPVSAPAQVNSQSPWRQQDAVRRQFDREIVKADCLLKEGHVRGENGLVHELSTAVQGVKDLQEAIRQGAIPDTNNTLIKVNYFAPMDTNVPTHQMLKVTAPYRSTKYLIQAGRPPGVAKLTQFFSEQNIQPAKKGEEPAVSSPLFTREKELGCIIRSRMDISASFNGYPDNETPAYRKDAERITRLLASLAMEGYRPRDPRVDTIEINDLTKNLVPNHHRYTLGFIQGYDSNRQTWIIPTGTTREQLMPFLTKLR